MNAHTPEPWTAELTDHPIDGSDAYAVDCPAHSIALMDSPGGLELNEVNARRIVACVNACAGVHNEELEDFAKVKCVLPGIAGVAQIAILNTELNQACDELAAALRDLLKAYDSILPGIKHIAAQDYAIVNSAPINARAALAKVPE